MSHYIYMQHDKLRNHMQSTEDNNNADNTDTDNINTDISTQDRSLSYWLKATGRLLAAEREALFEREGVTRRDWRILNLVSKGLPAHPRAGGPKMRKLVDRGWIARREGSGRSLPREKPRKRASPRCSTGSPQQ